MQQDEYKEIIIKNSDLIYNNLLKLSFDPESKQATDNISKLIKDIWQGKIKTGKYVGNTYSIYSSYIPDLTLENSNEFKLELEIGKSIEGTYRIDGNKLVLTSSDGDKSYILIYNVQGVVK